ncbi:MAG: hypothetical protein LBL31_04625 [Spirochaetaceae bacterium]|jgi:hypothetical protein|nr:hypothetical protein [Spirochaetaceae bacterium]
MGYMSQKSVRYGVFLPAAVAGLFLLFSCDFFEGAAAPDPVSEPTLPDPGTHPNPKVVARINPNGSGVGSVTLRDLSSNDVYLVKVNPSAGLLSGNVAGTAPGETAPFQAAPVANAGGVRVPAGTVTVGGQTITRYEMQWQFDIPPQDLSLSALPVNRSAVSDYTTANEGDTKSFWVLKNTAGANFVEASATLKKIGEHCKIWITNGLFDEAGLPTANDNSVNQGQIDALAEKFDAIYPLETNLLGYENGGGPDGDGGADSDPKIQILVYDIDGDFGGTRNGTVLGYFYSIDEYSFNETSDYKSNEAEIFYLDCEMLDDHPRLIYSTLIHEFNHMINFNVKVIEQPSLSPTNNPAWYTEMLSMLAEDVIGPLAGITAGSEGHVIKERIPSWLSTYANYGVMQWDNTDALGYYSSNYAFGAYLVRNFGGPALLSAIAKSPAGGRDSLDESLRELNPSVFDSLGKDITPSAYALTRFGEALVYSGTKPEGVYSFDNNVSDIVGGKSYTFSRFDIWDMIRLPSDHEAKGPRIYPTSGSDQIKPYGIRVTQDSGWTNRSDKNFPVIIKGGNAGMYYFVLVK